MKIWTITFYKCVLIVSCILYLEQVAANDGDINEEYSTLTFEKTEVEFLNITDFDVVLKNNNSFHVDSCEPNPCENGGTCEVTNDEINCICRQVFWGPRCNLSPCNPNPCKNDGVCEIVNAESICICNSGYYGELCEEVLDLCILEPCQNGGLCRKADDSYECECVGAYTGKNCEIALDLCEEEPCQNGGLCQMENGTYKCDCVGPYAGRDCETECDCGDGICTLDEHGLKLCECNETQALFDGKCVDCDCGEVPCKLDDKGKKKCVCYKNQTLSRGKCIECDCGERARLCYYDSKGGKQCVCLEGSAQLGDTCSVCDCGQNARSCLFSKEGGNVVCYCKPGYSQKNNSCYESCKTDKDCFNGGICRKDEESGNSFCVCPADFSGGRCQIDDACEAIKDICKGMGAICTRNGTIRICECPQGKEYKRMSGICEDICDEKKCNHGFCVVTGKKYRCICKQGYKGTYCDEEIKVLEQKSTDAIGQVIVLAILSTSIFCFLIGTICLRQRNKKLENELVQKNYLPGPRI